MPGAWLIHCILVRYTVSFRISFAFSFISFSWMLQFLKITLFSGKWGDVDIIHFSLLGIALCQASYHDAINSIYYYVITIFNAKAKISRSHHADFPWIPCRVVIFISTRLGYRSYRRRYLSRALKLMAWKEKLVGPLADNFIFSSFTRSFYRMRFYYYSHRERSKRWCRSFHDNIPAMWASFRASFDIVTRFLSRIPSSALPLNFAMIYDLLFFHFARILSPQVEAIFNAHDGDSAAAARPRYRFAPSLRCRGFSSRLG